MIGLTKQELQSGNQHTTKMRKLQLRDLRKFQEDFIHPQILDFLFQKGVKFYLLRSHDEQLKDSPNSPNNFGGLTQWHKSQIRIIFKPSSFNSLILLHECGHALDFILGSENNKVKLYDPLFSENEKNKKWFKLCEELNMPERAYPEIFAGIFTNLEHRDLMASSYILNTIPLFNYVKSLIRCKILPLCNYD